MSKSPRKRRVLLSLSLIAAALIIVPDPSTNLQSLGGTLTAPDPVEEGRPDPVESAPRVTGSNPATTTDADGTFRFTGLEKGTHQLYLEPSTLPAHLRPVTGTPRVTLWLNPGQSLVSDLIGPGVRISANYDRSGTFISGVVFLDQDADERRDPGEAGLAGVTIVDPVLHQYFVPFNDDDLQWLFAEIYNPAAAGGECLLQAANASTTLRSFLSVTASSEKTTIFYDHWEDGYDPEPLIAGSTTEVRVIEAGVTETFNDLVTTPRISTTFHYDGRDRISIFGEPASVLRAAYPSTPGEVLAGAWEVPEVCNWGRNFVAVIGEDLEINPGAPNDFDYVGLQVTAAQPNTEVWLNGTLTATLGVGETFFIDGANDGTEGGGIDSGDIITASGPIQVQMLGAACDAIHSARAYTLQPLYVWDKEYWAPVPDFTDDGLWCDIDNTGYADDDRDTDIYIHNPHAYPITVTFNHNLGPIPITVPPITTVSVLDSVPGGEWNTLTGAHLFGSDTFWGVSAIDSISGDAWPDSSSSNHSDWGYSLIPVNELSSEVIMGWSPGNSLIPPTGDVNGSLAFVSAFTDTVVYVDFTQDGLPDAFDMNGDGDADDYDVFYNPRFDEPTSDDGMPLTAGQVLRVADPNDNDLTGAVIYSRDLSEKIAVAWGQDPCRALQGNPFLDLGYTVLPYAIPSLTKQAHMTPNLCGVGPITYTLVLYNNGLSPMVNGVLTDTIPYTYTDFVVGSLQVSQPPALESIEYFNGFTSSWGYTPTATPDGDDPAVWSLRLRWPSIDARGRVTITLSVLLDDTLPDVIDLSNQAIFSSDATDTMLSQALDDPLDPRTLIHVEKLFQIDKLDEPDPVRPGDLLTYTIVATNTSNITALDVLLLENLPTLVTYQPNTLDLILPSVLTQVTTVTVPYTTTFTGNFADDFDDDLGGDTGYAGDDGNLSWEAGWAEIADDDATYAGEVFVGAQAANALSVPGYLELTNNQNDGDSAGVQRAADLTDFWQPVLRFYVQGQGTGDFDDTFSVNVNGTTELTEAYVGIYEQRSIDLSAYAGATAVLQFLAGAGMEPTDTYRVDNLRIEEASPLRPGTQTIVDTISVVTYTAQTGINPLDYDPVANIMTVTNELDIPPGAQARMSFQVRVDDPLTSGVELANTAIITSTNELMKPCVLTADETTTVRNLASVDLSKRRTTSSRVRLRNAENVEFLITITNTGMLSITHLPLLDTYDPLYLQLQDAVPSPTLTSTGVITWDDLTQFLVGAALLPNQSTTVTVQFTPLSSTQHLIPPVTVNTAVSAGAEAGALSLPTVQDDDVVEIYDPTAIELLYFRAGPKAGGVLVEWATLFEMDTYGFWLYRGDDGVLSHAVPVVFIPSQGWHFFGAAYRYLDANLFPGLYHYWLVEVENGGQEQTYGPVSALAGWDADDLPYPVYLPIVRRD